MKPIPRIRGSMWPAFVLMVLILLLPLMAIAQEDPGTGDVTDPGEPIEEVTADDVGDVSVVAPEDVVTPEGEVGGEEITDGIVSVLIDEMMTEEEVETASWEELNPDFNYTFQKQSDFKVVDRPNDEGGGYTVKWMPSPSDDAVISIPAELEGGEPTEIAAYDYWVFESRTGQDGSWQFVGSTPSNDSYIWQDPARYGFFLSETNKGSNEHYLEYTFTYPPEGLYFYQVSSVDDQPGMVNATVMVFDESVSDYKSLAVNVDLTPIGGEKVQLEYVEPEPGAEIWDNTYTLTTPWDQSRITETKPKYILVSGDVKGNSREIIEAQGSDDPDFGMTVQGEGRASNLPDNRFEHYFKLFAVPAGYELSGELPPEEWEIGTTVGPFIANANNWNHGRTNTAFWSLIICLAVMGYIYAARRGVSLFLRRIAGLDHVEEAIGRATEMGRPILYTTGLGYLSDIATIASINILGQVARKVADYEIKLIVPQRDPIVMAVCQEVVQEAYIDAGRPDAFNKDDVFFITDDQFAYAAAVNGIMVREKPATIILMGMFYAESLLLAETGASTGAIQIAGTDALAQLPFFITACDYTLIGEELYAASAYLSREPLLVGSLKGQDLGKMIFMVMTFLGTLLIFFSEIFPRAEFIQQLFQAF